MEKYTEKRSKKKIVKKMKDTSQTIVTLLEKASDNSPLKKIKSMKNNTNLIVVNPKSIDIM